MKHSEIYDVIFANSIQQFYNLPSGHCKYYGDIKRLTNSTPEIIKEKLPKQDLKQNNLMLVNNTASKYGKELDSCAFDFEAIQLTLEQIHNRGSSTTTNIKDDMVHILDVSKASVSELHFLLDIFKADYLEEGIEQKLFKLGTSDITKASPADIKFVLSLSIGNQPQDRMAQELLKFIPIAPVRVLPKLSDASANSSTANLCSWCNKECSNLKVCCYPRTGFVSAKLCIECINYNIHEDAKDWAKASLSFLEKTPNEEAIIASLGCALIAMALGYNSMKILKEIAEKLENHCIYTLAYSILCLALSIDKRDGKQKAELYFIASSILTKLAKTKEMTSEEKVIFALASKEALHSGLLINPNFLHIEEKRQEIESLQEQTHTLHMTYLFLSGDYLAFFKELYSEYVTSGDNASCFLETVQKLEENGATGSLLFPSDEELIPSPPFQYNLNAVLSSSYQKKIDSCIEELLLQGKDDLTFWQLLEHIEHIIDHLALIRDMLFPPEDTPSKNLLNCHQKIEEKILYFVENGLDLKNRLFHHSKEITVNFDLQNSPEEIMADFCQLFSNSNLEFEEVVMQLFNSKKWSSIQVAGAYIDRAPACYSSAEKVTCYLLAAMWMARDFSKSSKFHIDVLFAYKSILMRLLLMAFEMAIDRVRNPGLELHVIRLAIGIIRKLTLVPDSWNIFTYNDVTFVEKLLRRFIKVCYMFPFWNPPSISLSRAVALDVVTRLLHSEFLFQLQFIDREEKLLKDADLTYHLYCNDLRGVLSLKNSLDFRARAMNELLKSQGLTWNDARLAMSTQLCPRDEEGWIIPTSELGIPQDYSELAGFIFDADGDEPYIKLLVVEADPKNGRNGLFSQEDINVLLQLDPNDSVYFSLDPPSDDLTKVYHPFNQWRYSTEKLRGTEVLNTMFITDYLMKSFTTDSDISSIPPFKQRPCKNGLFNHLPLKLQHALRSVDKRSKISQFQKYRFWIEPGEVRYRVEQSGLKFQYHFGAVDMEVKSESLSCGIDKALFSTKEEDPHSPHISFAKEMTENYTELGKYFPVFARLQQLSKLHFFSFELQLLVRKLSEQCPEKAASLKCFIETYKKPQSQVMSSSKCIWVPASISYTRCYGGVNLWGTIKFIKGCHGKESLQRAYIHPGKIFNTDVLLNFQYVMKPISDDVLDCTDEINGIYMIQHTETEQVLVGRSKNVFNFAERAIDSVKNVVFSVVPLRGNLINSDFQYSMNAFFKKTVEFYGRNKLYKSVEDFSPKLWSLINDGSEHCRFIEDCSPKLQPQIYSGTGGVKFSGKGDKVQAEDPFPQYKNVTEIPIQVIHVKSNSTATLVEHVDYSPPIGNAEKHTLSVNDHLLNSADLSDGENVAVYMKKMMQENTKKYLSPLTLSPFREKNSTNLNKQMDRLFHAVSQ